MRRVTRSRPAITLHHNGTVTIRGILATDWSALATKISLHCFDCEKKWEDEKLDHQKKAADYDASGDPSMANVVRRNIITNESWHREMRRISNLLAVEFEALRGR